MPTSSPLRRSLRAAALGAVAALAAACATARGSVSPAPAAASPGTTSPTPASQTATAAGAATRAPAAVRLVPNWGVDTAAVARDYTGGARANPVHAVLAAWRAYLEDRPDSLHASPHWSAAEQRALPPGAEYDLTRGFVFQGRDWARGLRTTVLDVLPAAADSSAWQVRTLFARVGPDTAVRALGVVRTRVVREGGRWVLASPFAAAARDWPRPRAGRIRYVVAPDRAFDRGRAERAARFVDSLAAAFGVAPPDSVTYLVAGSPDEAQRALGMEWALATPGRAYAPNRFVYSGDPTLGEFYAHELAHLVLDPVAGRPGVPGMAQEGVATWVGGSLGRDFPALMREWGAFLRARPSVTLTGIVRGDSEHDDGWRPAGALLFQMVHEHGGMPAVRALLADLARPGAVLFFNQDEKFADAVARALGVDRAALDALVRARALRYADDAPAAARP